jgi:clan AA aspartic protease (TIGR02281 family)
MFFYRLALLKDPASDEAELGLVRSLIGKDQTADALEEAQKAITAHPNSALAEVAAGEAAYRVADFDSMRRYANAAVQDNECEGRGLALFARFGSLYALFATEAHLLATAHQLRPNDELIERAWIQSLPRLNRGIELGKYLAGTPALSRKELDELTNIEDHLKARRPDECHITSKADSVNIPFVPVYGASKHPEAYGLDVAFNGKHRKMQVDTGASGIVLTPAAAKKLGLAPEFQTHASGIGDDGEIDSYLTHVANIKIGEIEVSDCLVEVLQTSNLNVDGLIGIDVFDRWLVTLDYQGAELRLSPLPPRPDATATSGAEARAHLNSSGSASQQDADSETVVHDAVLPPDLKDWLRVVRIGHELLLPSRLDEGPTHYLIADTGADQTLLSLPLAKEAGQPKEDPDQHIMGISGEVKKVYRIKNAALQFGRLRLPPTSFAAFDITGISHDTGVEVSGLIGLPTLSRLTIVIDYRDNLMQLKYDPKRDAQIF